jgi:hypothetical protein
MLRRFLLLAVILGFITIVGVLTLGSSRANPFGNIASATLEQRTYSTESTCHRTDPTEMTWICGSANCRTTGDPKTGDVCSGLRCTPGLIKRVGASSCNEKEIITKDKKAPKPKKEIITKDKEAPKPTPGPCPGIIEDLIALREKYNEISHLLLRAHDVIDKNQGVINWNGVYIGSVLIPTLKTSIDMHGKGNPAAIYIQEKIGDLRKENKDLATQIAKIILAMEKDIKLQNDIAAAIEGDEAEAKKFKCKLPSE